MRALRWLDAEHAGELYLAGRCDEALRHPRRVHRGVRGGPAPLPGVLRPSDARPHPARAGRPGRRARGRTPALELGRAVERPAGAVPVRSPSTPGCSWRRESTRRRAEARIGAARARGLDGEDPGRVPLAARPRARRSSSSNGATSSPPRRRRCASGRRGSTRRSRSRAEALCARPSSTPVSAPVRTRPLARLRAAAALTAAGRTEDARPSSTAPRPSTRRPGQRRERAARHGRRRRRRRRLGARGRQVAGDSATSRPPSSS